MYFSIQNMVYKEPILVNDVSGLLPVGLVSAISEGRAYTELGDREVGSSSYRHGVFERVFKRFFPVSNESLP